MRCCVHRLLLCDVWFYVYFRFCVLMVLIIVPVHFSMNGWKEVLSHGRKHAAWYAVFRINSKCPSLKMYLLSGTVVLIPLPMKKTSPANEQETKESRVSPPPPPIPPCLCKLPCLAPHLATLTWRYCWFNNVQVSLSVAPWPGQAVWFVVRLCRPLRCM